LNGEWDMVATVTIVEANGPTGSPTWTPVTTVRYCTADTYNPGNSYPCVVPTSGYNYSYWKHLAAEFSGTFTQLSNWRWYGPGTIKSTWQLGTGGMLLLARRDAGDHGCPAVNYAQATGTQGQTGHHLKDATNGHPYYKTQTIDPADADSYTSANPFSFDSTTYTSAGRTKALVSQLRIGVGAVQGEKATMTGTIIWDEI